MNGRKEVNIIKTLERQYMTSGSPLEGERYYAISKVWLDEWKSYTGYSPTKKSKGSRKRPGRINNSTCIQDDAYIPLPVEIYKALVSWYGGGPDIPLERHGDGWIMTTEEIICEVCGQPAALQCSLCHYTPYCSRECQLSHWEFHRKYCKKLAQKQIVSSQTSMAGLVGLQNIGNTCFMATGLQCLSHTWPLTRYFLSNQYISDLNLNNPLGSGGYVACHYASLLKKMWMGDSQYIKPFNIRQAIVSFKTSFSGYSQQDTEEFLQFLLDGIHEDLNRVKVKPYKEIPDSNGRDDEIVSKESWSIYEARNDSIITSLFVGLFKSTIQCKHCLKDSVTFDPFSIVSVPVIGDEVTLEDCLEALSQPEVLDGRNQYYCSKCETHQDVIKTLQIYKLPKILVVHLKRFRYLNNGRRMKIDYFVDFPIEGLSLNDGVNESYIYDLYAVTNHYGGMGYGHYTALARGWMKDGNGSLDDEWFEFNDSNVKGVDFDDVVTSAGYVLFYRRRE